MMDKFIIPLLLVVGFLFGRITKKCDPCEPCINEPKIVKEIIIQHHEIEKLHKEIRDIHVDVNRSKRDSIRAIYNPR